VFQLLGGKFNLKDETSLAMNIVEVETNERHEPVVRRSPRWFGVETSRGYRVFSSSNLRLFVGASALALIAATSHTALAQTANLNVTATVDASCTLNGGSLPFGAYTGDQNDATGEFTYQCTPGTSITLSLDQGVNGERTMVESGGGSLPYELYSDSSRTTVWGVDTSGLDVPPTSAEVETAQVFGRIEAGEQAPAGDYSDTVQITLVIN
jgi:spore coat protein U-like protein